MARRYRRGRWPKKVARLADSYLNVAVDGAPAPGAAGQGPWHVVILTTARGDRLYTAMTRDVTAKVYASQSPYGGGYANEHAIDRLVLVETYQCRHTAAARMGRIRGWPVAERRRLIEEANPGWADLSAPEREDGLEKGSRRKGSQAEAWDPRGGAASRSA